MHTLSQSRSLTQRIALMAVFASAVALSACDRNDNRTAGEKLDGAVAAAERKGQELKSDAREAASDMRQSADNAGSKVSQKTRDMTITAAVNTELARDEKLSALQINVDSADGRVVLRGTAPDTASRTRATELAQAVNGVVSVDNELTVQPRAKP